MKELLITGAGFGLFIVCPRMAAMVHLIAKNSNVSLFLSVLIGVAFSVPIVMAMVVIFGKFGLWGALAFCVLTDICAALIMSELNLKAGIETLIIAVFVIIGVKIAPLLSKCIIK